MPSAKRIPKNPKVVLASAPSGAPYWEELRGVGLGSGLDAIGVAPAVVLERARRHIHERIDNDLVNGMKFTFLRPERSTDVPALLDGARSVIVAAMSYDADAAAYDAGEPTSGRPTARIARYAWADYYGQLKAALTTVAGRLRSDGHRAVVFADDNSIVDREVAWMAGLGWFGKNANILVPGRGSYFVLGSVVTTADLPVARQARDGCGACSQCISDCPTGAIVSPGVIDAHRCLSWLLQKPGVFPRNLRASLGDRIYGCDDCQEACPVTVRGVARSGSTTASLGRPGRPGRVEGLNHRAPSVDVIDLLDMDDATLDAVTDRWYVHQREMNWVRRNLLIILGNVGRPDEPSTVATLARYARNESPELRAHAVWAAARLGLGTIVDEVSSNPALIDEIVGAELANLPALRGDL